MIKVRLDDETLYGIRVATSPLWEALSSLALLTRYRSEVPYPYASWARQARQQLSPVLRRELSDVAEVLRAGGAPAFLTPLPSSVKTDFAAELAVVCAMPAAEVGALGARYSEVLEEYWEVALAPYWRSMRNVLEEEILYRGRILATQGAEALLLGLEGRLGWCRPQLTAPYRSDVELDLSRSRLTIVPTLFGRGMRLVAQARDGAVAISYQARGAAVLDGEVAEPVARVTTREFGDRLALLVGRGRASVIRALSAPATTTSVAEVVGLAPSTVSQHLSALSAAGLVTRRRAGARVLYALAPEGLAILGRLDAA